LAKVNSLNASNYVVSGDCSTTSGDLNIGLVTEKTQSVTQCVAGRWQREFNFQKIADGPEALQIRVAQMNLKGVEAAPKTVTIAKDTVKPVIRLLASGAGKDNLISAVELPNMFFSGTVEDAEPGTTVNLVAASSVAKLKWQAVVSKTLSWEVAPELVREITTDLKQQQVIRQLALPAHGEQIKQSVQIVDAAGNLSESASDQAIVSTVAPTASIVKTGAGEDRVLNAIESTKFSLQGTVTGVAPESPVKIKLLALNVTPPRSIEYQVPALRYLWSIPPAILHPNLL